MDPAVVSLPDGIFPAQPNRVSQYIVLLDNFVNHFAKLINNFELIKRLVMINIDLYKQSLIF